MIEFPWDTFPTLETERYNLRKLNESDIEDFFAIRSEKESMQYISRPLAKNHQDVIELMGRTHDLFLAREGINWAISEKGNSALMGTIGFYRMKKEHFRAEVGYQLQKKYFRKGVMYEVLQEVVKYGFEVMKLHSIEADINPDNIASRKLLEKSNFKKEGMFKENFFFEGKFYDSEIYSLMNPVKYFNEYN